MTKKKITKQKNNLFAKWQRMDTVNKVGSTIVLLIIIVPLLFFITNQFLNWQDRQNVERMKSSVGEITKKLTINGSDPGWVDKSTCTVIKPRLFGDKKEYYCTVLKEKIIKISNQNSIANIKDKHHRLIKTNTNITDVKPDDNFIINNQYFSISFKIKDVKLRGLCYVTYTSEKGMYLKTALNCSTNTREAYYRPIEEI